MSAKQKHGVVVGGHTICVTGAATRPGIHLGSFI